MTAVVQTMHEWSVLMSLFAMLWYVTLVVHLALIVRVWREYQWRYGTAAWRQAWGCFVACLVTILLRRWLTPWPQSALQAAGFFIVEAWITALLYLFIVRLSTVFHIELPMTTASEAAIAIDSHSLICAWSLETERLFGWTADEVVGKKTLMQTIMLPQDWEAHRSGMARLLAGKDPALKFPRTLQLDARDKGGKHLRIEVEIRTVHAGDPDWLFQGIVRRLRTL